MMKRSGIFLIAALAGTAAMAQEIHPLWVEHINGLVNVNPADKLSILIKRTDATGDSSYGAYGTITIHGFVGFLRYDDDHYLLGIRENGIDETTETDPDLLTAAAQVPDRSIIWLDAHTGKFLGVALTVPIDPVQNATQAGSDFFWKWGIDEGQHGQRVMYTTYRYKILRWAPAALVDDAAFPAKRPTWDTTPTEAWVEPVPGEPNPTYPPLDKFVPAIHYPGANSGVNPDVPGLPPPTDPSDPNYALYVGSSTGDGATSWRWKAFRVTGAGVNTRLVAGGGTWRASMIGQEFATDDGLTFYPVARLNERGDGWGMKGNYALGGQPSHIRTEPDGRKWCIQGHFPGAGWGNRPGRYTMNPAATNDFGKDTAAGQDANDAGVNHKERAHYLDPDNRQAGTLPAFNWEAAGTAGLCGPNHAVDGVQYYDGNWVMTADTKEGTDYIVSYAIPSWNQQFGAVGPNWPASIDPNSIFKPGWVGLHTADGKIAPGANNAWKLPCYETDEPIVDPNGNGGTGHDYGYDGDINVYPDPAAPAGSGRALVLAAFGEYGFGVFVVSNTPVSGAITGPAGVTTVLNQAFALTGTFVGTGSPLLYKWQKDDGTGTFVDIPGATGNLARFGQNTETVTYSVAQAQASDAGRYRCQVGNGAAMLTSAVATVAVGPDTTPPVLLSASSVDGFVVDLQFNELLDPVSAGESVNYTIRQAPDVINVQEAILQPDGKSVRLSGLDMPLTGAFSVDAENVGDLIPNVLVKGTANGTMQGFFTNDLGTVAVGGTVFSTQPGTYQISASGTDFWGNADAGFFAYQFRTGDFDVRVQVTANSRPSNRNSIMARDSVDPASAQVNVTWNPDVGYGAMQRAVAAGASAWFPDLSNWVCPGEQYLPPQVWLRLKRSGQEFTAYQSADGQQWTQLGSPFTSDLADPVLLGLAANSGGTGVSHTTFANYGDYSALSLAFNGQGQLILSWSGVGLLETAENITGPWSSAGVDQTNPQVITPSGPKRFYRLQP